MMLCCIYFLKCLSILILKSVVSHTATVFLGVSPSSGEALCGNAQVPCKYLPRIPVFHNLQPHSNLIKLTLPLSLMALPGSKISPFTIDLTHLKF